MTIDKIRQLIIYEVYFVVRDTYSRAVDVADGGYCYFSSNLGCVK